MGGKNYVDISDPSVSDGALCGRMDIANWLHVTVGWFDTMRRLGYAPKPCTPTRMRPKWSVGEVRRFYAAQGTKDPLQTGDEPPKPTENVTESN